MLFLQEASGHNPILTQIKLAWVLFEEGKIELAKETFVKGREIASATGMKTSYAVILAHLLMRQRGQSAR